MTLLSERFTRAVDHARIAHAGQVRKGTTIPYLQHLLGVASLVLEYGGDEDQAIAGLLHDTVEDCGKEQVEAIREKFGERVLSIVLGCTDGTAEGKAVHADMTDKRRDWLQRKRKYIGHLADAAADTLLVSGCDKLHNARAVVGDLADPAVGTAVFHRFTGGRNGTLAYYGLLAGVFEQRRQPMAAALRTEVTRMFQLAGEPLPVAGLDLDALERAMAA